MQLSWNDPGAPNTLGGGIQVISVDIPNHIELVEAETGPGVKGNTVSGGTKAAVLETGASIQVCAVCILVCIFVCICVCICTAVSTS